MLSLLPKALSTSKKTLDNATILYNINIRPRVLTIENATLEKCNEYASKTKEFCQRKVEPQLHTFTEKYNECASNAQIFYQQKVEPKVQKAKSIAKTEYGEYKKEIKNSLEIHMPLEFISESLPAKYRTLFITTMAPISHIAKKAAEEREDLNRQKFKTEAGNELKASLMTEGVLYCAKNIVKKLPPLQRTVITAAICGTSHYLVNNKYIDKEISRKKEIIKKEKANENKGTENSANRGCRY